MNEDELKHTACHEYHFAGEIGDIVCRIKPPPKEIVVQSVGFKNVKEADDDCNGNSGRNDREKHCRV